MKIKHIQWMLLTILLAGCSEVISVEPPPITVDIPVNVSVTALPTDLLDDAALTLEPDPNAPPENQEWATWIQDNYTPIRSLTSEHYDDLQFLKPLLAGRMAVQLGEPAHGVAEINTLRVRMVKFLHEEMKYDVIAFESGLFECYTINDQTATLTPTQMLTGSLFSIWHTQELYQLYDYLKATKATDHPLELIGFDIQHSNWQTAETFRPQFLHDVVETIDPAYADQVYAMDKAFFTALENHSHDITYWQTEGPRLQAEYQAILTFFETHSEALNKAFPESPQRHLVAQQVIWSIMQYIPFTQTITDPATAMAIRDLAMADNLDFILSTLYPGKRVIIWAHNAHIRYNNQDIQGAAFWLGQKTMGNWINERYLSAFYTIGFYPYRGEITANNRQVFKISPVNTGSLESILYQAGSRYAFVDLVHQTQNRGNTWMFQPIEANELMSGYEPLTMIPREQYDAIIFIDTVNPPDYLF